MLTRLFLALLMSFSCFLTFAEDQEPLFVVGSTTVAKLIEASADDFYKAKKFRVISRPIGSKKGIVAIGEEVADIGLVSRYLTKEEQERWPNIQQFTIAQDAIVFMVNKENLIENIEHQDILKIYAENINDWKVLNPALSGEIKAFSKANGHGTLDAFNMYFGLTHVVRADGNYLRFRKNTLNALYSARQISVYDQVNQAVGIVKRLPLAIAYESLGAYSVMRGQEQSSQIKILALNGEPPIIDNKVNPNYPFIRPLNLLINSKSTSNAKAYIDFMLSSGGQRLILQSNYIPIENSKLKAYQRLLIK